MSEPRLRLRRLVIHKFGDLLGPTELEFADGMNVIIGENGGGKSTLLRLIVALICPGDEFLKRFGMDVEIELTFGALAIAYRLLVARREKEGDTGAWNVVGQLSQDGVSLDWTWGSDRERSGSGVAEKQPATAETPDSPPWFMVDEGAPELEQVLIETWLAGWAAGRLDEANEAFASFTGGSPSPDFSAFLERSADGFDRARWALEPDPDRALDEQRWSAADSTWLASVAALLRASDLGVKPGPSLRRGGVDRCFSADIRVIWPDGSYAPAADALSFGQKRLLALFWQLNVNKAAPLISDELVNGFHHSWVRPVLDEIGDRQSIVAVQNPLLLDELSFDSADDVRRAITLCRMKTLENGRRQWIWEKPSMEQAERLFEAWGHGMSYVSELLKREGLW